MPNQLSANKVRTSYIEFSDVFEKIKALADARRETPSDVIRAATQDYVLKLKSKRWSPAQYSTPKDENTKLRKVTYAEWDDIRELLCKSAESRRIRIADLIREITRTYTA